MGRLLPFEGNLLPDVMYWRVCVCVCALFVCAVPRHRHKYVLLNFVSSFQTQMRHFAAALQNFAVGRECVCVYLCDLCVVAAPGHELVYAAIDL